ncbi:hypothetical protein D3C85_1320460 [compost metagenome]
MRLPQQFIQLVAAHFHEGVVGVGHVAVEIGGGHEGGIVVQRIFILSDIRLSGHDGHPLQVI